MTKVACPAPECSWESQEFPPEFAVAANTALEFHVKLAHLPSQPVVQPSSTKPHKMKMPHISAGSSPDQWAAFLRRWSMYKVGMQVSKDTLATTLFDCCDDDLSTDLMRDVQDDVASMSEDDLLKAIKRLAIKEESILVHRIRLGKMTQAPGIPIRTFLASLRGEAALCQYVAKCKVEGCEHVYDYSTEIIRDNLIRGIADPEILADIICDAKTDRTLEQTVSYIAQKEQGKATIAVVGADSASSMTQSSSFSNRPQRPPSIEPSSKCWACGDAKHGKTNDRNSRAKHCQAWGMTCTKCHIKGHYPACCSKCNSCSSWGHRDKGSRWCPHNPRAKVKKEKSDENLQIEDDSTGALYDQLCTTKSTLKASATSSKALEHHVFEGKWIARPSKPHPVMTVKLTPLPQDHAELGHPLIASKPSSICIPMVADSGCQSSIIPLRSALAMGIHREEIFPVSLGMRGAIEEDLGVQGGVIVEVTTTDESGTPKSTKQMIYVSSKIQKAFLCREALVSLGAIPPNFPSVPTRWPSDALASLIDKDSESCSCPRRGLEPPPIPTELPAGLQATPADVPALKQWLLDRYAATTFNTCEHQALPMMNCEPLELHVDPKAKPTAIHKPAAVPIHWQERVYQDLERDVRLGVLEKVEPNTPATWCSRMVVTAKSDGSPRRTVDLQPQNRHSVRQTQHVQSPFHLAVSVPQNTKKTVTDAWNGYHSVPIKAEDRHFTTFITPWGRYRYKVAPQGFLASGDAYNQRFDQIIADFPNKVKCVDDTCMWASSIRESFFQTCRWLELCAKNGITLNPKNFQFAQDEVEFAGLAITQTNVKPSTKFLDSINNFPRPKDITGARAWFGLVNQGAYAFSMAKRMKPFRHLLQPKVKFEWTEELDAIFEESKKVIIQEMKDGVRLFQPHRPTCLITDWSTSGIGFLMMQKYCKCSARTPVCCKDGWKLCLVGSRFTHNAEERYAPIEGEALGIVYALQQTRYYTEGCTDLIVATDHKPLVGVLNDRPLTDIANRRLLNLKEKTLAFRFDIIHLPGKRNAADAASRYPATSKLAGISNDMESNIAEDEAIAAFMSDTLCAVTNVTTWDMVKEATASDESMRQLSSLIQNGFPEYQQLSPELRPYQRLSGSLSVVDGVILAGSRLVIPPTLRPNILSALHAAHQGVSSMATRAADSVYWPNLITDLHRVREGCVHCHKVAKSNPMQPPSEYTAPEFPFQKICADFFSFGGHEYVVIIDRYSNWPMTFKSENGAEGLVKRLRECFVTFGVPEELTSDGGPQFTANKTKTFLTSWGVHHRLTSVANPHANCRAEVAVKTVKRMMMDNTASNGSLDVDKFQRAMLMYRNSIDPETRASPAQILFGRPIRDAIPIPMGRYCPHSMWVETLAHRERALAKRHSREHEKWKEHTKALPALRIGDHVFIQNLVGNHPRRWERTGTVVEVRQFHQYVIKIDGSGRLTLRNRQHLRKYTPFQVQPRDSIIESLSPAISIREPAEAHESPSQTPEYPPTDVGNHRETPESSPPEDTVPGVTSREATPTATKKTPTPVEATPEAVESVPTFFTPPASPVTPSPSAPPKIPRALARLLPHNALGNQETPRSSSDSARGSRRRRNKE